MAKNKNWRDDECALKKTHQPNHGMKEKKRHSDLQKLQRFNNKNTEEQQAKDKMARQAALEKMGMPVEQQEFGLEDHKALYNYAQQRVLHQQAPIKVIDALVAPPKSLHILSIPVTPALFGIFVACLRR